MKFIIAVTLLAFASGTEFTVKDAANKTCVMLTVDGTLALAAFDGAKQVGTKSLKFDGASVLNASDCKNIKLDLTSTAQVWFQLDDSTAKLKVDPISTFDPEAVFGKTVNETDSPMFQAKEALGNFTKGQSFACLAMVNRDFALQGTATKYNYTVQAKTSQLQVQFGNIENDTFSSGPHCTEDTTTSTQAPTTQAPTTSPPSIPVNDYNVTNQYKNVTCIKVESGFKVEVTYAAGKENMTYAAIVPASAKATGNCDVNATTSNIVISFNAGTGDDWKLKYTFTSQDKGDSYFVSEVDITYSNLPNATVKRAQTATATFNNDYLKASTSGYYLCNAGQTADIHEAQLTTNDFKYKAFNDKDDIAFNGDVAECSADEETSSVVPIAVGAALAGLVVIVLVAYLIGRRRSRKSGYESV